MKGLNPRFAAAIAVTAALLVSLAVFGGPVFAGSRSASAEYQYKVTICHITGSKKHPAHTISVSSSAVNAHLAHGDHLGACTGTEKPRPHGTPSSASQHGASQQSGSDHGKGNGGHDHGHHGK